MNSLQHLTVLRFEQLTALYSLFMPTHKARARHSFRHATPVIRLMLIRYKPQKPDDFPYKTLEDWNIPLVEL